MNARITTDVTIETAGSTDVVTVEGNWSLHYFMDESSRATVGVEDKGIYNTSVVSPYKS